MSDLKRFKRIKKRVIDRDGLICCYCGIELTINKITMDHIIPESQSGVFNYCNLTVSCRDCNHERGDQSFFEFSKQFNFSSKKLEKYNILYIANIRIRILNVAKSNFLIEEFEIPIIIIGKACDSLNFQNISFEEYYPYSDGMDFNSEQEKKKISTCFNKLIKIIEQVSDGYIITDRD
jgi:hypothetical protein